MEPNALLISCDAVYAAHPRPRWAGKVMALFRSQAFDGLGNSSRLQGKTDKGQLDLALSEIPVMRLPDGFHAVAILDLAAAEFFADGETQIDAELELAG